MDVFAGSDFAVCGESAARTSAYDIDGPLAKLTGLPVSGAMIQIIDIQVIDKDIALPVVATDNVRVLFKFGQDFGEVNIIGRIYRGASGSGGSCSDTELVKEVLDAFQEARLSARDVPTTVSIAGATGYNVYPVNIKLSDANGLTNSIGFVIGCILAPDPEGK